MAAITNHVLKTTQLSRELLVGAYRTMYLSRLVDEKEIQFKRQRFMEAVHEYRFER